LSLDFDVVLSKNLADAYQADSRYMTRWPNWREQKSWVSRIAILVS